MQDVSILINMSYMIIPVQTSTFCKFTDSNIETVYINSELLKFFIELLKFFHFFLFVAHWLDLTTQI